MKKMAAAKPVLGGAVAAQSSPFPLARGRPHLVFTCCLCSSAALGGGVMPARSLPRCVISCSPNIFPPSGRCASCAPIVASRTSCIGCSMSSSTRIATKLARQRAREPRDPPKARPQSGAPPPCSHIPAPENQTRGLARRLLLGMLALGHARSYAIPLPTGGRGADRSAA